MKKFVSLILIALLTLQLFPLYAGADNGNTDSAAQPGTKKTFLFDAINFEKSYSRYYERYKNAPKPNVEIIIPAAEYTASEGATLKVHQSYEGVNHPVLEWDEYGYVEWEVDVPQTGLYNLAWRYFPTGERTANIERELYIDGERPFTEARSLVFQRVWEDKKREHPVTGEVAAIISDNRGNDIRPSQVEHRMWQEEVFRDADGLYREPFFIYLTAGRHRIRLNAIREPVIIDYLKLYQHEVPKSYEEVKAEYERKGYKKASEPIKIQAENSYLKSDPTLYPIFDRSNPLDEPYSPSKIKINTIGGYNWRRNGQWIEWEFEVPEDGLYVIGMKYRQNYTTGIPVTRQITIDGKVPFKEVERVYFNYDTKWQMKVLGEETGTPYLFYLTKGKHVLRMTNNMGDIADVIRLVQEVAIDLSQLYTQIIMITGTSPDPYRDYLLDKRLSNLIPTMERNAKILRECVANLKSMAGGEAGQSGTLETLAYQLEQLVEEPDTIPRRLSKFNDNVMNLSVWSLTIKEQPLELDYFLFAPQDYKMPRAHPNIFQSAWHMIRSFVASFTEDYDSIGNVYSEEDSKVINVWVALGQDQANTLKAIIDESFTPETGIFVNLNIMQNESVLLFATASGKGPDVALNTSRNLPVDYGIRNALADLSKLPGFNEVKRRFQASALNAYSLEGKVYGLPQTHSFPVLFYRKDVFNILGLEVPETWEDVYRMLPRLQENNLEFGPGPYQYMPGSPPGAGMDTFNAFLLQNGGKYYTDDGKRCILDDPIGIEAFKEWTNLFTSYGLPRFYDFYYRFRTGSMPIGISDYTMYNQLTVAAPEITGLWGIAPLPGTRKPDGSIDRTIPGGGTSMVILKNTRDLESSWKFLEWWTRTETQVRYGRELEALLGLAARYNTSNMDAVGNLAWPSEDYKVLMEQWRQVNDLPIIPGSYFIQRHITNAFLEVIDRGEIPREALTTYVREINKEITKKRREFGLD